MAVLVNNLGGSSAIELAIMTRKIVHALQERSITVERLYSGPLMTALDMHGVSCSLIPVDDERCLDGPPLSIHSFCAFAAYVCVCVCLAFPPFVE